MRKTILNLIKKIIKLLVIAASIIALMPIIFVLFRIGITIFFIILLYPPPPSDAEMIKHFKRYEKLFEELGAIAENDSSLSNFPLSDIEKECCPLMKKIESYSDPDPERELFYSIIEKFRGETLPIFGDREKECCYLMMKKNETESFSGKKIVYSIVKGKKILFFTNSEYPRSWIVEKGFEYIPDRTKEEKNKKFTEKELYSLAKKKGQNCSLYKKINENWNLYLVWEK